MRALRPARRVFRRDLLAMGRDGVQQQARGQGPEGLRRRLRSTCRRTARAPGRAGSWASPRTLPPDGTRTVEPRLGQAVHLGARRGARRLRRALKAARTTRCRSGRCCAGRPRTRRDAHAAVGAIVVAIDAPTAWPPRRRTPVAPKPPPGAVFLAARLVQPRRQGPRGRPCGDQTAGTPLWAPCRGAEARRDGPARPAAHRRRPAASRRDAAGRCHPRICRAARRSARSSNPAARPRPIARFDRIVSHRAGRRGRDRRRRPSRSVIRVTADLGAKRGYALQAPGRRSAPRNGWLGTATVPAPSSMLGPCTRREGCARTTRRGPARRRPSGRTRSHRCTHGCGSRLGGPRVAGATPCRHRRRCRCEGRSCRPAVGYHRTPSPQDLGGRRRGRAPRCRGLPRGPRVARAGDGAERSRPSGPKRRGLPDVAALNLVERYVDAVERRFAEAASPRPVRPRSH
jgi:hypothetical protein